MNKKLQSRINKVDTPSIQIIVACVLIITILPMNLLYIHAARRSVRALISQAENAAQSLLTITAVDIAEQVTRTDLYMSDVIESNAHYAALSQQQTLEAYRVSKFFLAQNLIDNTTYESAGDTYFVYSEDWEETLIARPGRLVQELSYQDLNQFVAEYIRANKASTWHLTRIADRPYLMCCQYWNGIYFGALISLAERETDLLEGLSYDSATVRYVEDPEKAVEDEKDGRLVCVSNRVTSHADLYIVWEAAEADVIQELSFLQRYSYSIALGYLVLIPLLLLLLGILLIQPIQILLHAISEVGNGNTSYRVGQHRVAREYRQVYASYDHTLDTLQDLKIRNYEIALEKQQTELQNLQLMIRPHFLQNTLGLLYTLSQMEETAALGRTILYLSDYFRHIYRSNDLIPFTTELELIKGYLAMSEVQFPGTFEIHYEIDPALENIKVPPLLIHNFIENVISHASRKGDYLVIALRLHRRDEMAVFEIQDNGIGIPAGTLEEINQGHPIRDQKRLHIGVYNAWKRLEIIYQGRASLHYDSIILEGTTVTVQIPIDEEEFGEEHT